MIDFEGRVVLITGAGGGLGRTHALAFAERGASVVVNDLGGSVGGEGGSGGPAEQVAQEIRDAGGSAVADTSSVSDPAGGETMVARAIDEFGRIDVVVNNAGILRDRSFAKLDWADLDAVLDVHLKGAFYVTRPAFLHMKEQGYGRIIVTTSASGLFGNFGQTNYAAAKLGLVGLANVLKHEGAKYGITANVVAPLAKTRMAEELLGEAADRFDPALVTPAVLYLASEECGLTGEIWSVAAGTVTRVFIGLGRGWVKHPGEGGPPTPEDIAANLDEIRATEGFTIPTGLMDDFTRIGALLAG